LPYPTRLFETDYEKTLPLTKNPQIITPVCLAKGGEVAHVERDAFKFEETFAHPSELFAIAPCGSRYGISMEKVATLAPAILGGEPVFAGTEYRSRAF
jgi:hypothetical protein